MKAIGSVFSGGRVQLDGNQFVDCHFEGVSLVFAGTAPVHFNGCHFVNVRWEFDGPAVLTLSFLAALYRGLGEGGRHLVEQIFEEIRRSPQFGGPTAPAQQAAAASPGAVAGADTVGR